MFYLKWLEIEIEKIMKKLIILFFVSFLGNAVADPTPWPFSVARMEQAVFRLEFSPRTFREPNKTGFIIEVSGRTYIVTTFQAIKDWDPEEGIHRIINKKGRALKAKGLTSFSFLHNLALIEVEDYVGPVLKLADFNGKDSSVYMLGFPGGNLKQMQAESVKPVGNGTLLGVRDIPLAIPGSSGGPVFNNKGKVIGVISTGYNYQVQFRKAHLINDLFKTNGNNEQSNGSVNQWIQKEMYSVLELARMGNPEARYALADDFHQTYQKTRDPIFSQWALDWYKKAAEHGHFMAQMRLGLMYRTGEGVIQDLKESEKWFKMAANQNRNPLAKFSLARTLIAAAESQEGFQEGIKLMRELVEEGFKPAQDDMEKMKLTANTQGESEYLKPINEDCNPSHFQ